MPMIGIDLIRGRSESEVRALMDSVHDAVVKAFEVPPTDRYQIVTQHEAYEISALDTGLGIERTDALVMIRITSSRRTQEAKLTFYELLAANLQTDCGISSDDLIVTITENGAPDWSFGHGTAQFVTGDL